ncbi:MAG: DPP IV N-terminal domain-containing protein [Planctomycetaceae bacterium]
MTARIDDGRDPDDLVFPRQLARTRSFSCGQPRTVTAAPDGRRVVFLRSNAGDDPVHRLWVLDVETGQTRCAYDPLATAHDEVSPTPAERARRERMRERATGVVGYATDRAVEKAAFVEGGRLLIADLLTCESRSVETSGVPDDPRLDPAGAKVAYVVDGALYVQDLEGGPERLLARDDDPDVRWGLPDFAAAEEMRRMRGFWWSPDGARIAATRVDERPVQIWWLSNPTDPEEAPVPMRYPRAGTPNAVVTLHVLDVATGERVDVAWDEPERFEYLARVVWSEGAPLTLLVQSRDQRETRVLEVDHATGATTAVRVETDERWVELVEDTPLRLSDGRLVTDVQRGDTRRLAVEGEPVTPEGLQVRSVLEAGEEIWFAASADDPTCEQVWRVAPGADPVLVTPAPGLHTAAVGGNGLHVLRLAEVDARFPRWDVVRGEEVVATLENLAEEPVVDPRPRYLTLGERGLRAALLLPGGVEPDHPLPVLMSPYGGPHFQQAVAFRGWYREDQWFADRLGAAVLIVDGRGTPGRGLAWEREVWRDFTVTLEDQVDGLHAAAEQLGFLDLDRVGIHGWSFGGELAAFAVLLRPDVFGCAVAGAPVGDQRLYDTHYTERYLGDPNVEPDVYDRSSPVWHARERGLTRPLLLIHGLSDDNVFAANTLQLSGALMGLGCRHELLLIPKASHMGGSDDVVVARTIAELDFFRRHLVGERP